MSWVAASVFSFSSIAMNLPGLDFMTRRPAATISA